MPAYQVTGPDGKKYRVNAPEGASSQDAIAYVYDTYYAGGAQATPGAAEPKPEDQSVFRQVADVPVQAATGVAQGIRMITDTFGADNPVSQNIRGVENYLQGLLSAQAKQDQREISRIMQEAQDKGVGEQVVAGLKAFATAPVDTLSQAAGTALPTIVGGLAGAALKAPALLGAVGTGAVMGAGTIKSDIYDQVKGTLTDMGATPEEAERRAVLAQEYGGENLDQILLGTVIGGVAGRFGLEETAAKQLARDIARKSVVKAAAKEAVPEAVQAAQEQVAQNVALQREGIDVPTFRGAVGAGTLEGVAGAGLGAAFERFGGREQAAPEAPPEEPTPDFTPEQLAPKTGRAAQPSPVRAKTLDELRGQIPAAPPAPKAKEEKAPREPMVFERTKEPTPEALQEAAEFVAQFPEGSKNYNLFKAKAIAKKLGYENIPQKGVGRIDIEPLLRNAVQPTPVAEAAPTVETAAPEVAPAVTEAPSPPNIQVAPQPLVATTDISTTPSETTSEPVSTRAGEAVDRAVTGGTELPVQRVAPAARAAGAAASTRLEPVGALAGRVDEREGRVEPALKAAALKELPSTELANLMAELRKVKPRPVEKMFGKNPTAEQKAKHKALLSSWQSKYNKVSAAQKVALERDNAAFRAAQRVDEREGRVEPALKAAAPAKKAKSTGEKLTEEYETLTKQFVLDHAEYLKLLDRFKGATDEAERAALRAELDAGIAPAQKLNRRIERLESALVKRGVVPQSPYRKLTSKESIKLIRSQGVSFEEPKPFPLFLSLDVLNRTAPDVAEQANERAPSLRVELRRAKRDYDAGFLTGDQLAETTGNLLLKTQKERIVQPRKRGADYIRERLLNARRNGFISQEGVDLAEWFIRQNPLLVDDLGISIRTQPEAMEGTAGFYNNISRVINLFKGAGDNQTATHEIMHHLERLMPANIRSGILKAYVKQLTKAQKNAKTEAEKAFFRAITNYHYFTGEARNAEYNKALDIAQKGEVPKSFYQYINPSEFWAVNGARIVQGRYGIPPGIIGQIKRWLRDFIEKAKDVFGLKSDAAIIRALDSLAKADGKYQTDRMLAEAPDYRAVEPIKKAKPTKPKKSIVELRREASAKMMKPGIIRQVINKLTSPETNYETLAKNFQNVSRKVTKIEEDLRVAGRLISVGEDKNNIGGQTSIAANRAAYIVATEVEPVAKRLRESLASYARVMKGTIKDALEKADSYRIALHEQERRETKYLRNVPLNNTTKMEFLPGEPAMTAADARAALEKRRSLADTPQKQEAVLEMMRYLAANHADPLGYSPVKAQLEAKGKEVPLEMTTDFYDDIYNVIGTEYTQEELEATRQEYEGLDAETKAAVDQVFADFDALNELNKNLNRRANYWTDKVDNVIGTYGWKHYAPFKGNPRADKTLDTDTEYLSGELSEAPESFEGRRTQFDSPILQSIAESYFAASRAGRGTDVTQTIKNLIKLGVITTKTKKPKVFTFEERNAPDFDYSQVQGRDKVLHYNEDGSVEVYSIKDPDMLEAIKVPYREMNLAVKIGNALTSSIGQLHTRFNIAFAPMDLIRNTVTNAGLISAREGGKAAREYLTAVAADVARLRMFKAGKLSNLLAKNDIAELNRLAKTDPFYRDVLEMRKYGGATFYRMSFNISNTMEELNKQVGPKKILTEPSMLERWVDAYNDAFELTSRVSAYTLRKQNNIAEAKKKGLDVNDPKVMEDINKEAAAFSLRLMDFRKIGKYGKELSAWFMFIRPAATGAVDAIDALRPGFFLKPESAVAKGFARLEPEIQGLFETQGLAQEIERIKGNKRPDKKKIVALEQEIVDREKAFDTFEKRQLTRAKNARNTALFTVAAGAALYAMAVAASDDDDQGRNRVLTDDMSRWTRYLRLPVIGDKGFFQIPWGFGVSALSAAGAQVAALARGASSFRDFAGNMVEIGMDSFLPIPTSRINPFENFGAWLIDSASPSVARPLVEFVLNVDAMGNPIYNSRSGKYADAFSGSTRPSELHRAVTETIYNLSDGDISVSPDAVAFVMNNYADGINHLAENSWNLTLTAMGDKNFDAKKDTFLLRSFIGRNSNYDARQYAEAEKQIQKLSEKMKTFEDLGTPAQVDKFYRENPNADLLVDTYNKGRGQLSKLQQERKAILLDRSLTPKQREDYVESVQLEMDYLKKLLVEDFKAYSGN